LYPLGEHHAGQTCHGRGANLSTPAPHAATLPKELSRQLIRWLFRTSTWAEASCTTGPLQYHYKNSPVVTLLSYKYVSPGVILPTLFIILTSI
ncbi:MAG: hypothetical protein ACK56F_21165, partial [bacterium]